MNEKETFFDEKVEESWITLILNRKSDRFNLKMELLELLNNVGIGNLSSMALASKWSLETHNRLKTLLDVELLVKSEFEQKHQKTFSKETTLNKTSSLKHGTMSAGSMNQVF